MDAYSDPSAFPGGGHSFRQQVLTIIYVRALRRDCGKQISLRRPRLKDLTGHRPHMMKSGIQLDPSLSLTCLASSGRHPVAAVHWGSLRSVPRRPQWAGAIGLQSKPRCPAVALAPYRPLCSAPLSIQGASTPTLPS